MPGLLEEPTTKDNTGSKPATNASSGAGTAAAAGSKLPGGVVLGEDGKPCRTCTSSAAWMAMMKSSSKPISTSTLSPSSSATTAQPVTSPSPTTICTTLPNGTQCPPDVEELGRSTWTLLHTLPATYPPTPTPQRQSTTYQFISLFSQLYPCHACATDFRDYLKVEGSDLQEALKSQEGFGRWMCRAHNAVNRKLGKEKFDCNFWRRRWVDGPGDGGCG